MESHIGGPIILTKFVKSMDEYNEDDENFDEKVIDMCTKKAFQ